MEGLTTDPAEPLDAALPPDGAGLPEAIEPPDAPERSRIPESTEASAVLPPPAPYTYRIVRVASVEVALPDQFPTIVVEDEEGEDREVEPRDRLAFRIGTAEGVALAHALAGTAAPRPLTHDLFALALESNAVEIVAVRLTGRRGATYFAEIELIGPGGRQVLSCRPSDGICLALRQRVPAPLLCDERLFTTAGDVDPDPPASE